MMALRESNSVNKVNVTPSCKKHEPVFKTPLTFSPRIVGEQLRPSPSIQLWKTDLRLENDCDTPTKYVDDDTENLRPCSGTTEKLAFSPVEYHKMERELEERNAQRDDLLFRIKSLTDKNRQFKTRIQREEVNKQQHLRTLEVKTNLIENLQSTVEELEAQITAHRARCKGEKQLPADTNAPADSPVSNQQPESPLKPHTCRKLVEQIFTLEADNSKLTSELASCRAKLESLRKQDGHEQLSLLNKQLEASKAQLQEEIVKLKSEKGTSDTDTQKLLQKLEIENDSLQADLRETKQRLQKLETESEQDKKVEEENEYLRKKVTFLEEELALRSKQLNDTEEHMKTQVKKLSSENQNTGQELRSLRGELRALHAKPPDVVTKVERVEIESDVMRRQLDKVTQENIDMRATLQRLQLSCESQGQEALEAHSRVTELENQVVQYQQETEKMRTELGARIEELEGSKASAIEQLRKESEDKLHRLSGNFDYLRNQLAVIRPTLTDISNQYVALREQVKKLPELFKATLATTSKQICAALGEMTQNNDELVKKYRREMALRKKYHNELVELKGNIRVFCRVRPTIKEDGEGSPAESVVSYDRDDDALVNISYKGRPQKFELDKVFTNNSSQEEVFDEVQALVVSCIDGYNVCIFAYGQTGSGKTYTMEGPKGNPGINQRALKELFKETAERASDVKYTISVSMMEIYNETLRDLLSPETNKLEIKKTADGIHVPGLIKIEVHSVDDINHVFSLGKQNRATASTNMNEHSSRSHALLCVTVVGVNKTTGAKSTGKLNLVDLAGSERISKSGAEGARLKEAQNINKSLACIGDVIHALRSKQAHVPYRNSRLTYLLQDSLGGDSKTLMIVQVSPVEKNVGETVASLNFAQRVRCVELGTASKKVENPDQDLKEKLLQLQECNGYSKSPSKPAMKTPRKK